MVLTLYAVSDGPPSLAVRQCLKALNLEYKLVPIDFNKGEHLQPWYEKLNPQREIPVLDDDGFLLSERQVIDFVNCFVSPPFKVTTILH